MWSFTLCLSTQHLVRAQKLLGCLRAYNHSIAIGWTLASSFSFRM
jgi:hypothetical protein